MLFYRKKLQEFTEFGEKQYQYLEISSRRREKSPDLIEAELQHFSISENKENIVCNILATQETGAVNESFRYSSALLEKNTRFYFCFNLTKDPLEEEIYVDADDELESLFLDENCFATFIRENGNLDLTSEDSVLLQLFIKEVISAGLYFAKNNIKTQLICGDFIQAGDNMSLYQLLSTQSQMERPWEPMKMIHVVDLFDLVTETGPIKIGGVSGSQITSAFRYINDNNILSKLIPDSVSVVNLSKDALIIEGESSVVNNMQYKLIEELNIKCDVIYESDDYSILSVVEDLDRIQMDTDTKIINKESCFLDYNLLVYDFLQVDSLESALVFTAALPALLSRIREIKYQDKFPGMKKKELFDAIFSHSYIARVGSLYEKRQVIGDSEFFLYSKLKLIGSIYPLLRRSDIVSELDYIRKYKIETETDLLFLIKQYFYRYRLLYLINRILE